jgi:hypothetical protein
MTERPPEPDHRPGRRASDIIGITIVTALVLGLFSAPIYVLIKARSSESTSMTMSDMGGAAVELSTLQPAVAKLYRGARDHGSHFEQIPCFCGCEEGRLQHRHLLDCFLLGNGGGWESHATGCAVCQGEARLALRLLSSGTSVGEVRKQIIEEFGLPQEMRDLQEE